MRAKLQAEWRVFAGFWEQDWDKLLLIVIALGLMLLVTFGLKQEPVGGSPAVQSAPPNSASATPFDGQTQPDMGEIMRMFPSSWRINP